MQALRLAGMEHGKLHVTYVHDGQCNLEYSPEQLSAIAGLGLLFCVSCEESAELYEQLSGRAV